MTTKLTTKEFELRLKALTRDGEPSIMGTPFCILRFNLGREPFFGQIENTKFRLTNNSSFFPTGTIIEGNYKEEKEMTEVDYSIRTMAFLYFWVRFVPIFGLIAFNSIIVINSGHLN